MNGACRETLDAVPDTAETKLREAQRAWVAFRDAEVAANGALAGASGNTLKMLQTELTEARTKQLKAFADAAKIRQRRIIRHGVNGESGRPVVGREKLARGASTGIKPPPFIMLLRGGRNAPRRADVRALASLGLTASRVPVGRLPF